MNLLPGLRELRAPLAAGYLWITTAALWLIVKLDWMPEERPDNQDLAQLWDIGGLLGKAVLLGILTFVAYLIGSLFEFNPDGPLVRAIAIVAFLLSHPLVLFREDWRLMREMGYSRMSRVASLPYNNRWRNPRWRELIQRRLEKERPEEFKAVNEHGGLDSIFPLVSDVFLMEARIRGYLSHQARTDLERYIVEKQSIGSPRDRADPSSPIDNLLSEYEQRDGLNRIILRVVEEMPQLASRLLVRNKDL